MKISKVMFEAMYSAYLYIHFSVPSFVRNGLVPSYESINACDIEHHAMIKRSGEHKQVSQVWCPEILICVLNCS